MYEGEILSSVSKAFDLLIVEEDEPLPEHTANDWVDREDVLAF